MKPSAQSSRAPLPADRRAPPGPAVAAGLAAVLALACAPGCAMYARIEAPAYGRAWTALAEHASGAADLAAAAPAQAEIKTEGGELARASEEIPEAKHALERLREVSKSPSPGSSEIRGVIAELETAERAASRRMSSDSARLERLRAEIAEMRRKVEAKLLEVLRIEPSFDVSDRGKARIAVMKMGDSTETIRDTEKAMWMEFLGRAGFDPRALFIAPSLTGGSSDAAAVRAAAARLGADAVLIYATFSAVTKSPLGESAAVLSFAKCMLLDTRTEYLYLNAEGECREKRIGIPGFLSARGLEIDCAAAAAGSLRVEIGRELARLSADTR